MVKSLQPYVLKQKCLPFLSFKKFNENFKKEKKQNYDCAFLILYVLSTKLQSFWLSQDARHGKFFFIQAINEFMLTKKLYLCYTEYLQRQNGKLLQRNSGQ